MQRKNIMALFSIFVLLTALSVWADLETTTVTFVIPSEIDHSLSYGGSCSSANFYYVENDGTLDGTQARVNLTSDTTPWSATNGNSCQNATVAGITITNGGSSVIDVYMNASTAYPAGAGLKAALADAGYEVSCTGTVAAGSCGNILNVAPGILVANAVAAQGGTQDVWIWGNMSNFNGGAAGQDTETLGSTGQIDA